MLKKVEYQGLMYAIIIQSNYRADGIEFFTPPEFSQQLALMSRPRGHIIQPHFHRKIERQVFLTQEVLLVKKGRVRVNFYNSQKEILGSETLEKGDVILLSEGGHGFEVLEDCEMLEVKQGPYLGDQDKVRFDPKS